MTYTITVIACEGQFKKSLLNSAMSEFPRIIYSMFFLLYGRATFQSQVQ